MHDKTSETSVPDVMELSGSERMMIGVRTFEEFREQIIASMPKDLSPEEFKQQLFERIYGARIEDFLSGKVTDADIVHENWP